MKTPDPACCYCEHLLRAYVPTTHIWSATDIPSQ